MAAAARAAARGRVGRPKPRSSRPAARWRAPAAVSMATCARNMRLLVFPQYAYPWNHAVVNTVFETLKGQGFAVGSIASCPAGDVDKADFCLSTDTQQAAYLAAKGAIEAMGGAGNLVHLTGNAVDSNTQRRMAGLAVDLHREVAHLRGEDDAALRPEGRARRARAGATGALLAPGLDATARHHAAIACRTAKPRLMRIQNDTFMPAALQFYRRRETRISRPDDDDGQGSGDGLRHGAKRWRQCGMSAAIVVGRPAGAADAPLLTSRDTSRAIRRPTTRRPP